jgi:alpha-1,3-mannosyltransferase
MDAFDLSATNSWNILGVAVETWERHQAVRALANKYGDGMPTCVAFANANLLNQAASNHTLYSALKSFVVLNDGLGTDIAALILHNRQFPSNLNGSDFVPFYLNTTDLNHRIFIIGARSDVVQRAAHALRTQFEPRHKVVGWVDGFDGVADTSSLLDKITESGADLLLVGMGNPRQELWVAECMPNTGSRIAFCVGALLDYLASEVPRAPRFLQRLRLEWAYRLTREPRRLSKRYVIDTPVFLLRVLKQRFAF